MTPPEHKGSPSASGVARRLGGHVVVYGTATVLAQSVSLLTTPIFTRVFGPTRYGALEVASTVVQLAVVVVVAGLDLAVQRAYVDEDELAGRQRVVSSGFLTIATFAVALAALGVAFRRPLASALFGTASLSGLAGFAALNLPLAVLAGFSRSLLRLLQRPGMYLASSTLFAFAGGGLAVVYVVAFDHGLAGVYMGLATGALLSLVFNLVVTGRLYRPRISAKTVAALAAFGLPLLPVNVSTWALRVFDRFLLVRYESLTEIGYYALASRFANLLQLGVFAFNWAWVPFVLRLHGDDADAAQRLRAQVLAPVTGILACGSVALSAFAPELLRLLAGDRFDPAANVVPPLVFGLALFGTTTVTSSAMLIHRRTRLLAVHAVSAAAVNIVAGLLLIPAFGIAGAAAATVLAYMWQAVAFYLAGQKVDRVDFGAHRAVFALVLAVPYHGLAWLDVGGLVPTVAVKAAVALTYPAILLLTGVLPPARLLRRPVTAVKGAKR